MNKEHEERLETAVHRALNGLPEIMAPVTLLPRVMAAIRRKEELPWYRQAWQVWPLPMQVVSMTVLIAAFGGLFYGTWQLMQLEGVAELAEELARWKSGFAAALNVVAVLGEAILLVINRIGKAVIIGCIAAAFVGSATCISLGTLWVRLVWARGNR